jgi:signal transduction histidine kinase
MIDSTLKNAKILIVDDQQSNVDILLGLLEAKAYPNVYSTTDPREVLGLFEKNNPDILLLDLLMPHFTGYQIMEKLKPLIPRETYFPILVLTADVSDSAKLQALAGGAKDFLTKPFDLNEVDLRISNLLQTRYLHLQLQNQNKILEEKVMERTLELENTIKDLEIAKVKAEASDRLKTAFMNNISHEIRTPLNGILGFGELLAEMEFSPEEKKEMLAHVKHSSNRLMNTVTDYMDMARIVSGTMNVRKKEFQLQLLFEEIINKTRHLCANKMIELETETPTQPVDLMLDSDPELISKIFNILFDNALKFTAKGSISCGYNLNNGFIKFFVEDTGKGIDSDKLEMIFNMFSQEDTSNTRGYEGSGLGLSIARGLVNLLGGTISVASEKGKGSIFKFTVPYSETEVAETFAPVEKKNRIATGKPLILLAEDDESNYLYMEVVLKQAGCDYLLAKNGFEAVELCKQHTGITLVLMDIKMPVMNGLEATKLIHEFSPELPVIAITAYAQTGDEQRFLAAGCNGYIAKPISKYLILSLIQKYFN